MKGVLPGFLSAALGYILISTFLLWPLVLHPTILLFGGQGDVQGLLNHMWADAHRLSTPYETSLMCAPYGLKFTEFQPLYEKLLDVTARLFGEVAGYNILVFLSFP